MNRSSRKKRKRHTSQREITQKKNSKPRPAPSGVFLAALEEQRRRHAQQPPLILVSSNTTTATTANNTAHNTTSINITNTNNTTTTTAARPKQLRNHFYDPATNRHVFGTAPTPAKIIQPPPKPTHNVLRSLLTSRLTGRTCSIRTHSGYHQLDVSRERRQHRDQLLSEISSSCL